MRIELRQRLDDDGPIAVRARDLPDQICKLLLGAGRRQVLVRRVTPDGLRVPPGLPPRPPPGPPVQP